MQKQQQQQPVSVSNNDNNGTIQKENLDTKENQFKSKMVYYYLFIYNVQNGIKYN